MSSILENLLASIETLNSNVSALTAALAAGGAVSTSAPAAAAAEVTSDKPAASAKGGKGSTTKAASTKAAAEKVQPKFTVEEVAAIAVRVKEELGTPAAQELIKTAGKADKLKEMKPENYDAFVEAAEKALEGEAVTTESEDDL